MWNFSHKNELHILSEYLHIWTAWIKLCILFHSPSQLMWHSHTSTSHSSHLSHTTIHCRQPVHCPPHHNTTAMQKDGHNANHHHLPPPPPPSTTWPGRPQCATMTPQPDSQQQTCPPHSALRSSLKTRKKPEKYWTKTASPVFSNFEIKDRKRPVFCTPQLPLQIEPNTM